MTAYEQVIEFLYTQLPMFQSQGPGAYKPGLDTARMLDAAFGHPHQSFRSIHIAGTNGKGSTAHTIASVLQAQGLKVGLYTSPHLVDFRERIRVDGQMISREAVVDFVERYRGMQLPCSPSFFELTTIMAFDYFARMGVDVAVVETGLGGRLDTTNIISPILSVITNISLDHVALLGDTEEQIAAEKAGIIKPGVPVVIGEADGAVRQVFDRAAKEKESEIIFAQDYPLGSVTTSAGTMYSIEPGGKPVALYDLQGDYQQANARTVMAALRTLRSAMPISDGAIIQGFSTVQQSTGLAGRWMQVQTEPFAVITDTGHNVGAWRWLGPKLREIAAGAGALRMVVGFVNDKDVSHIFDSMPREAEYYFVTPSVARGRDSRQLLALAQEKGFTRCRAYATVAEGFAAASAEAAPGDTIYVGGSTFVVADYLASTKV